LLMFSLTLGQRYPVVFDESAGPIDPTLKSTIRRAMSTSVPFLVRNGFQCAKPEHPIYQTFFAHLELPFVNNLLRRMMHHTGPITFGFFGCQPGMLFCTETGVANRISIGNMFRQPGSYRVPRRKTAEYLVHELSHLEGTIDKNNPSTGQIVYGRKSAREFAAFAKTSLDCTYGQPGCKRGKWGDPLDLVRAHGASFNADSVALFLTSCARHHIRSNTAFRPTVIPPQMAETTPKNQMPQPKPTGLPFPQMGPNGIPRPPPLPVFPLRPRPNGNPAAAQNGDQISTSQQSQAQPNGPSLMGPSTPFAQMSNKDSTPDAFPNPSGNTGLVHMRSGGRSHLHTSRSLSRSLSSQNSLAIPVA